mgnify:FL=1
MCCLSICVGLKISLSENFYNFLFVCDLMLLGIQINLNECLLQRIIRGLSEPGFDPRNPQVSQDLLTNLHKWLMLLQQLALNLTTEFWSAYLKEFHSLVSIHYLECNPTIARKFIFLLIMF